MVGTGVNKMTNKEEYMQIEQIVNELVNKKILERCKE